MTVSLRPATLADAPVLDALAQLYAHDFSEFTGDDVGADGRFAVDLFPRCFGDEATERAYVVTVDAALAGFAVVGFRSRFREAATVVDVAQFFVVRSRRRRGVGAEAARALFDLHRGRRIEVREMAANLPAQRFWRAVVDRYTGGRFVEVSYDDARWRGPVQSFVVE